MASMSGDMSRLSAERNDSDIKSIDEIEAQQTSGTTRNSGVNTYADTGDLSDDDYLPTLEEIFKTAPALSNQRQKRKPTSLINLSDSDGDSLPLRKRHCDRASRLAAASPRTTRPVKLIDLTTDTEHCALCPNVLGEGQSIQARMFVFTHCGCVVCGTCFPDKTSIRGSHSNGYFRCWNHAMYKQIVWESFAMDCAICWEDVADSQDRVLTKCGHSFCRSCVDTWIKKQHSTCPRCRKVLPTGTAGLRSFRTVQRGVVREIELEC